MPAESETTPLPACPYCGTDHPEVMLRCPTTDMVLPLAGRLLAGKFRFVAELGRGGMGAVWRARNIHVDREVAIKLILPEVLKNPEIVARFRDEARVAAKIGHPGICDILDFELTPLGPIIVMELLRGENLGQRIDRQGPLPVTVAVSLIRQALAALGAAHRVGIIHRDLKPENLFLHLSDSGAIVVKLMDFGISKFTDRAGSFTGSGVIMGTPEYMAPEQVSGAANADERTDLWAIGAVLYKAVTGVDAFVGSNFAQILLAITSGKPAPVEFHVSTVSRGLSAVIMRCLSREPDERFQSAAELSDALQQFERRTERSAAHVKLGSLPTLQIDTSSHAIVREAVHDPDDVPAPAAAGSSWPRWIGGLLLLAGLAGGVGWYFTQGPGARDRDITAVATRKDGATGPIAAPSVEPAIQPTGEPITPVLVRDPATTGPTPTTAEPAATSGPDTAGNTEGATGEADSEAGDTAGAAGDAAPARLIIGGNYVTPSVAGKPGNQRWAKEYCEALARNKFLAISRWKLANPAEARAFTKVEGIKPAGYWTTANHKGVGKVVWLPRGTDSSIKATKKVARPLCVASKP